MYIVQVYEGMDRGWIDVELPDGTTDYHSSLWKAQQQAYGIEQCSKIMTRIVDLEGNIVTGE